MPTAFDPITLGRTKLANRLVMAPMSRSRSYGPRACPSPSAPLYYAQRATAGLIVTEGIQPCPIARGYPATPGLFTPQQVSAWRDVTMAVHDAGGVIFAQLMHAGRIGHPSLFDEPATPVAPSAVTAAAKVFTRGGPQNCVLPRALSGDEITRTIDEFVAAARNAVEAGFDGVELHGGNGFLLHQFLSPATNLRTDAWGGDAGRRRRFVVELARAVSSAIGPHRVGIQLSPGNPYNDMTEPDLAATYQPLVEQLDELGLAYLSVLENRRSLTDRLRARWSQVFVLNPATGDRPTGVAELSLVDDGTADMVSYGKLFLANPDLPRRLAAGGPFTRPDPATFYGGDDRGYVDYPSLS
jgi:N-ethylmaleimide reductase